LYATFDVIGLDVEVLTSASSAHRLTHSLDGVATRLVLVEKIGEIVEVLTPPEIARRVDRHGT
jgi:hypothetical protein